MPLTIPAEVLFRDLGGESVLLHLGSGQYFGLDEVGTRIWTLVAEGCEVEDIEARLLSEYDAGPEAVHRDVVRIIDELRSRNLLEFDDASEAG
ncbi:MAG: PqqD family protein [Thermoanaerobaculia bacterium]